MKRRLQIPGPGRRMVEVELSGPELGPAVICHAGTPSVGRMFDPLIAEGASRGLRHVSYSRPGYGSSERQAGRSVADCTADVAAIADALEIERFYTVGSSGGGPHALACAALLDDRVIAAACVAGAAPVDAEGLDWMAGMGNENVLEFGAAMRGPDALSEFLETARVELIQTEAEQLHAALGDLIAPVDRATLTGAVAEHLAMLLRVGLAPGAWGWFVDDLAFVTPWGFDVSAISTPVTIWHGEQDRFVPFGHGRWLANRIPGATAQLRPEHGHLSLSIGAYGEILDGLIGR